MTSRDDRFQAEPNPDRRAALKAAGVFVMGVAVARCAALPAILAGVSTGAEWLGRALELAGKAAGDLPGLSPGDQERVEAALAAAQQAAKALAELVGLGAAVTEGDALLTRLRAVAAYSAVVALIELLRARPAGVLPSGIRVAVAPVTLPTAAEACVELAR